MEAYLPRVGIESQEGHGELLVSVFDIKLDLPRSC